MSALSSASLNSYRSAQKWHSKVISLSSSRSFVNSATPRVIKVLAYRARSHVQENRGSLSANISKSPSNNPSKSDLRGSDSASKSLSLGSLSTCFQYVLTGHWMD